MTTAPGTASPSVSAHGSRTTAILMVVFSLITVASLGFPLVTPLLALAGMVLSIVLLRRHRQAVYAVTLVVCSLAFVIAGAIDLTLLGTGVQIGHPGPADLPR